MIAQDCCLFKITDGAVKARPAFVWMITSSIEIGVGGNSFVDDFADPARLRVFYRVREKACFPKRKRCIPREMNPAQTGRFAFFAASMRTFADRTSPRT